MILNRMNLSMMKILRNMYRVKRKALKKDWENRRLMVETWFIYNIYKDINFLNKIPLCIKNERYFYLILRNCFEQTIILRFLEAKSESNPNIFNDYMGDNVDMESLLEIKDDFEVLKKIGGERTKEYKNRFREMAREFEDIKEDSVYKFYGMLADYCHNSYFHNIEKSAVKEKRCDRDEIQTAILVLLTRFLESFE